MPFIDPPISVVSQPAYRIGEQAANPLTNRINGRMLSPIRKLVLGTDLIIRESSLRADEGRNGQTAQPGT